MRSILFAPGLTFCPTPWASLPLALQPALVFGAIASLVAIRAGWINI
jgi:hypothetical protein